MMLKGYKKNHGKRIENRRSISLCKFWSDWGALCVEMKGKGENVYVSESYGLNISHKLIWKKSW